MEGDPRDQGCAGSNEDGGTLRASTTGPHSDRGDGAVASPRPSLAHSVHKAWLEPVQLHPKTREGVRFPPPVRTLKSQGMAGTDRPPHFLGELHSAWESSLLGTRVLRRHILSQEPAQTRKDEKHRSLPGAQKPNAGLEGREKPVSKRGPRGWQGRRPRPGLSEQQVPCPADEATAPRPLLVIACQVP